MCPEIILWYKGLIVITLSFTVGREDVFAFYRSFFKRSGTMHSIIRRCRIACLLIFLAGMVYGSLRFEGNFRLAVIGVFLAFGVIWYVFLPKYLIWRAIKNAERMFDETALSKLLGNCELRLSEEGLSSSSPMGRSHFQWQVVNHILLTPSHLVIVLAGGQGYPVPRTQIPESQIEEARRFIESKLPTR